jgi:hypothetical protein
VQSLRDRDGVDHFADSKQLSADLAEVTLAGASMTALLLACLLPAQAPNQPRFVLHSTVEPVATGIVEKMDASGAVTIVGRPAVVGADVIAIRRLDGLVPAWPREPHLVLANGDQIVGKPIGIDGSFLLLRPEGNREGERLRFPLTSSSILWLRAPETVDRERLHTLLQGDRAEDHIILRNGDVIAGVVTGLDSTKGELTLEVNGAKRSSALDKVAAIAFSTRLARVRKPTGAYWRLVLANGSRLTLIAATIEKGELRGQTMYKDPIQIALANLSALEVYQGKAVYLSDLKPTNYQYRPYQGEKHPWAADRSLRGTELQLQSAAGIATFDKGIATHGECSLSFSLEGKYRYFECQIGLDPMTGKRGSAMLRVQVDGRDIPVNDGKGLTLTSGIISLRADVSKGKELKLIVEWGEGGNVGDCVNWGDARLIP